MTARKHTPVHRTTLWYCRSSTWSVFFTCTRIVHRGFPSSSGSEGDANRHPILSTSVSYCILPFKKRSAKLVMYAHMLSPVNLPPVFSASEGGGIGRAVKLNSPCTLSKFGVSIDLISHSLRRTCLMLALNTRDPPTKSLPVSCLL